MILLLISAGQRYMAEILACQTKVYSKLIKGIIFSPEILIPELSQYFFLVAFRDQIRPNSNASFKPTKKIKFAQVLR